MKISRAPNLRDIWLVSESPFALMFPALDDSITALEKICRIPPDDKGVGKKLFSPLPLNYSVMRRRSVNSKTAPPCPEVPHPNFLRRIL